MKNLRQDVVLSFRLNPFEAELVRSLAASRGRTFSDLVRKLVLAEVRHEAVQHLDRRLDKSR